MLQSALSRPQNRFSYEDPPPDAADLAACYAFGLVRNHPFIDGNKRVAFVVAELFLALNGFVLEADDAICVAHVLRLAEGSMTEKAFAKWVRESLR